MSRVEKGRCEGCSGRIGFTLVELLTVIGIIAILGAMLIPALSRARERARTAAARGDIQTIAVAMESYSSDFNRYPRDDDSEMNSGADAEVVPGLAIVYYLSDVMDVPYVEFESGRLEESDAAGWFVYNNPYDTGYYRFRNNYDRDPPDFSDHATWDEAIDDWDVCYVNRSSVDIWTDDMSEDDFVELFAGKNIVSDGSFRDPYKIVVDGEDYPVPTWRNLRGMEDIQERYQTISNW